MERGDSWIILRTSGGRTLALANALEAAGIEAWTPRQLVERVHPKTSAKVKVEAAIFGGFVFARASHLVELAAERSAVVRRFPSFSFFNFGAGPALVRNSEIERVRKAHAKAERVSRMQRRRALVMGQRVRFDQGVFSGMSGRIVRLIHKGQSAMIDFGGRYPITIDACDFPENLVSNDATDLGDVA